MCVTLFRALVRCTTILRPISKQHDACTYTRPYVGKRCVVEIARFHRNEFHDECLRYIKHFFDIVYFDWENKEREKRRKQSSIQNDADADIEIFSRGIFSTFKKPV